jgi:hypothetical protein
MLSRLAVSEEALIDHPASSNMLSRPAVSEDVLVLAAGLFESICQDREAVEGPFLVDGLSKLDYRAVIPGKPIGINSDRMKGVEDVPYDGWLPDPFNLIALYGTSGSCP